MSERSDSRSRIYAAIDLKSFYASVECAERHLDPLSTHLVVADASRTEKTICLAVSPSLKAYGISGRARLFEVVQAVREINALRRMHAPGGHFASSSFDASALAADPALELSYITAVPRMSLYMSYSTRVYQIYLKYIAPEDIHVYSIDECFLDLTDYLPLYHMSARELTMTMIREVLYETGITATGGIGSNLFLCKVAMDIVAKHVKPDKDGVRIAELQERSFREQLWDHRPLTDFWRVGSGYARRLAAMGLYTMGDIARCSVDNEEILYRTFGINAELLIDHAWGWEPVTLRDIKGYRPQTNSLSSGQVLQCPYDYEKGLLIVKEMTDLLILDLVDKGLVTDQIVLTCGYDRSNLEDPVIRRAYHGPVVRDYFGRLIPEHAHGSSNLGCWTSGSRLIMEHVISLYEAVVDPRLLIRRVNITAAHVIRESEIPKAPVYEQLDLFTDYRKQETERREAALAAQKEKQLQKAMLDIKKKFGKNAVLKGMNLEEGGRTIERNRQIGGHKA